MRFLAVSFQLAFVFLVVAVLFWFHVLILVFVQPMHALYQTCGLYTSDFFSTSWACTAVYFFSFLAILGFYFFPIPSDVFPTKNSPVIEIILNLCMCLYPFLCVSVYFSVIRSIPVSTAASSSSVIYWEVTNGLKLCFIKITISLIKLSG